MQGRKRRGTIPDDGGCPGATEQAGRAHEGLVPAPAGASCQPRLQRQIAARQPRLVVVSSLPVGYVGTPYRYWLHLVPHDHQEQFDPEGSGLDVEACRQAGWELVSSRCHQGR